MQIIKCTNGVGEWEIDETHETFDTYEEALEALNQWAHHTHKNA